MSWITIHWIYYSRGDSMSYVDPILRDKFESLSIDLKNSILERNVEINTIYELIHVLEEIVKETEDTFI